MVDLSQANATALAQILAFPDDEAPWGAGDLGAMLRHQLRSPWLIHVPDDGASSVGDVDQSFAEAPIASLGALIRHPTPPKSLLALAKDHTKNLARRETATLPPEVARMLYYVVLAAAVRAGERDMTTLSDAQLRDGLAWAAAQEWIDPWLHDMLVEADCRLAAGDR